MMTPRRFGPMTPAAALLATALVASPGIAAPVAAEAPPAAAGSPNPLALLRKNSFKAFIEKPLFDPARSLPFVAPVVVMTPPVYIPPPEPPPSLRLLGVIEGENAMAIARGPDMKTLMLHSGDHIGAWSVLVTPNGLHLSNGERSSDYGLFTNGGGKGVTPGPMPSLEPAAGVVPKLGLKLPGRARNARLQPRP